MGSAQPKILEDVFEVLEVDPDGKKFDKGAPPLPAAAAARRLHTTPPTSSSLTPAPSPTRRAVSRLRARSDLYELDLLLDVNVDLFPVAAGDKLALALASTLREDGSRMPYDIKSREELYDPVRASTGAGRAAARCWQ
jgi:DNA-directed RNA polymerase I, II, and III subunit RPABC3